MNDQQLEQMLRSATARTAPVMANEETRSLRHAYVSLGQLLAQQPQVIDEATLVQSIFAEPPANNGVSNREAWLAMAALAASILVFVSLGISQLDSSTPKLATIPNTEKTTPKIATTQTEPTDEVDASLAWDDPWEERLEDARDYAAEYRLPGYSRLESTSWSASQELREIEAELESL